MPDFHSDAYSGEAFETSVRQVAQHLYADSHRTGSIILDGRERDEIIDTGTELIIIEATKKRTLDKVKYDLKKSTELVRELRKDSRYGEYNFRIILVTLDEPTADQNKQVAATKAGCPKEIISFSTLFSRLLDARHYIRLRGDHFFGSIRNPADDRDLNVPLSSYIPTALSEEGSGANFKASDLAVMSADGGAFIIFGDYGSGKSMTLRDIYFRLRDQFIKGGSASCPVYLNLREHIAQTQPDEALYRHADRIGFANPQSLISAWRAGYVTLLLDGFDELTPPQFAVSIDNLRQARRFAVELIKRFIEETPNDVSLYIAGRANYFDDREEAKRALGFSSSSRIFDLAGFTDSDIERYLKKKGGIVPSWLPTRPLLLGYIANSGLLTDETLATMNPAAGWDNMLQRVCEREVQQIWGVGFEPEALRQYIEGLATRVRKNSDPTGLQQSDLRKVFHTVFGKDADEPAHLLASRLPGLGAIPGKSGVREFIDDDFMQAAASGDLTRYLDMPFVEESPLFNLKHAAGPLSREMCAWRIGSQTAKITIALKRAVQNDKLGVTSADLFSILNDMDLPYTEEPISIRNADFGRIEISGDQNLSAIAFEECTFSHLEMGRSTHSLESKNFPRFKDCLIDQLEGVVSQDDLPSGVLVGSTSIEQFVAYAGTNDAIIKSNIPEPVKVLLTILRKLFLQKGSGRLYSALRRGIPQQSLKYVDPVADLIRSFEFAEDIHLDRRHILIPNRSRSGEAFAIINGPNVSTSPLVVAARQLSK